MLRLELYKIFKRPRTYISFGVVLAISLSIQLAMYADGKDYINLALQMTSSEFEIGGNIVNGYLITYFILQTLLIQVPLLIALVAGDAFAGEANKGTLRLLLTKPVSRTSLVLNKYIACVVYSFLLLIWLAIVGLGLSVLIFGIGDMVNVKGDMMVVLLKNDILWRYLAAFVYATLAMMAVAALSVFLSIFADNSVGPIIGTMAVIVVMMIYSNMNLPLFNAIKPYLFTTHMIGWKGFFDDPVPYASIYKSAAVLGAYIVAFLLATILIFKRKDIKS